MEVSRPLLFLIGKQYIGLSIVAMPDLTVQSGRAAAQVALCNIMRNSHEFNENL